MRKICSAEGHDILRCPIGRRSTQSRLGCFHTPKSSSGIPLQMDSPVKTSFEGITPVKSDALQFPEVRALLGSVGSFRAMLARLSVPIWRNFIEADFWPASPLGGHFLFVR